LVGVVPQMGDYGGGWRYAGAAAADSRRGGSTPTKRTRRDYGAFFVVFFFSSFPLILLFFVALVSGELSIEFYELSVSCASHFAVLSLYPCKHPS
jgi:hypothetical protein